MKTILTITVAFTAAVSAIAAEALPRVLFISDPIHRSTAGAATAELKERAELVVPALYPGDSGSTLVELDKLLGDGKWDAIHFNFGFADLRYIDPNTKSIRVLTQACRRRSCFIAGAV